MNGNRKIISDLRVRLTAYNNCFKPKGMKGHSLCCCSANQMFVKHGKAWRYKSTGMQVCS